MSKTFTFKPKAKTEAQRAFVSLGDTALCVSKTTEGKNRYWLHQVTKRDEEGNVVESRALFIVPEVDSQFAKSYGGTNKVMLGEICREALASVSGVPESAATGANTFADAAPV